MPKCKGCQAEIIWIKTVNGKNMPCNAEKTTIVTEGGETIVGHIPHWSTCPQFKNFKRGSNLVPGGEKMDKLKSIAERLNGIEYRDDIPKDIIEEAKANRIVIVFGRSDDLMEFEGAIYDEVGCYEGGSCVINYEGKIRAKGGKMIQALWCDKKSDFTWTYKTKIPHETFDMFDEDEKYCKGIVFSLDSLKEETSEDVVKRTLDYIEEE